LSLLVFSGMMYRRVCSLVDLLHAVLAVAVLIGVAQSQSFYPSNSPANPGGIVASSASGRVLYSAGENGIYSSFNYGSSWVTNAASPQQEFNDITVNSTGRFVAVIDDTDIFISANYGVHWTRTTPVGSGTSSSDPWYSLACNSASGQYVLAAPLKGYLYISSNHGRNWTATTQLPHTYQYPSVALSSSGQYMAVGFVSPSKVYISSNYGSSWTTISAISCFGGFISFSYNASEVSVLGCNDGAFYHSADFGHTWTSNNMAIDGNWQSTASSANGQYILAGSSKSLAADAGQLWISSTFGAWWSVILNGPSTSTSSGYYTFASVAVSSSGQFMVAGTTLGGWIFYSSDYGKSWRSAHNSPTVATNSTVNDLCMSSTGSIVYAAVASVGIYRSVNYGANWTLVMANTSTWASIACSDSGTTVIAGATLSTTDGYSGLGLVSGYVWLSTNSGGNWTSSSAQTGNYVAVASDSTGQYLVVGASGGSNYYCNVFSSSNFGASFTTRACPTGYQLVNLASDSTGSILYLAAFEGYIFRSSNYGASWVKETDITLTQSDYVPLALNDNATLVVVGNNQYDAIQIYTSSGGWLQGLSTSAGVSIAAAGMNNATEYLFAGGAEGLYISTDYGAFWASVNQTFLNSEGVTNEWNWVATDAAGVNLVAMNSFSDLVFSTNVGCTVIVPTSAPTAYPTPKPTSGVPSVTPTSAPTIPSYSTVFYQTNLPEYRTVQDALVASSSTGQILVVASSYNIFAATAIYISSNYGSSWFNTTNPQAYGYTSIATNASAQMIILTNSIVSDSIYISDDFGYSWRVVSPAITSSYWNTIACSDSGQYIIVGQQTAGSVYLSSDYGYTWNLTTSSLLRNSDWNAVATSSTGKYLFAAETNGLYMSSNYGQTWSSVSAISTSAAPCVDAIQVSHSGQWVTATVCDSLTLWRSNNYGSSWTMIVPSGISTGSSYSQFAVAATAPNVQIATVGGALYVSNTSGIYWTAASLSVFSSANFWKSVATDAKGINLIAYNDDTYSLYSTNPVSALNVPTARPTSVSGNSLSPTHSPTFTPTSSNGGGRSSSAVDKSTVYGATFGTIGGVALLAAVAYYALIIVPSSAPPPAVAATTVGSGAVVASTGHVASTANPMAMSRPIHDSL
jgi:hypothetical protein